MSLAVTHHSSFPRALFFVLLCIVLCAVEKIARRRRQLFGILLTLAEAVAFVVSGMYGPLSALGAGNAILIVCQLFLMGVILILMDQVLQKG